MTEQDVLIMLKRACNASGSQKAWAKANGFSNSYVSDVLNKRRDPADEICKALGVERAVIYRPLNGWRKEKPRLAKAE